MSTSWGNERGRGLYGGRRIVAAGTPLSAALLVAGCATIQTRPPQFEDVPLRTVRVEVPSNETAAHADLGVRGSILEVAAIKDCNLIDQRLVRRTTRVESYNASPATDWVLLGGGIGFAAAGGVTLIDSSNVASSDKSSRTYNPIGPGGALGIGIGLSALGAGLLGLVIADVVRANHEEVSVANATLDGEPLKKGIACSSAPYANAAVVGQVDATTLTLGTTDAKGTLSVDINQAVAPDWVVPYGAKMSVLIAGQPAGSVDIGSLYVMREVRAWGNAEADRCRSPKEAGDCNALIAFSAAYRDGPHREEAEKIVSGSHGSIRRILETQAWKSVSLPPCQGRGTTDPDAIDAACKPVQDFAQVFPDGVHFREAQATVNAGTARAAALRAEIARRQRAEQSAEEARERIGRETRCRNVCLVECSHHFNEGSCLAGCVPLCISQGQQ